MNSHALKLALLAAYLAVCALLFEWGSGAYLKRYGDSLDRTREIVRADPFLGWRSPPDYKATFLGHEVETNELGWRNTPIAKLSPSARKVLVLGPSSAFGWGVAGNETYSSLLGARLPEGTSVINAGEIGYSTFQGLRLLSLPEVRALKPAVIVVAYGVNDVDRHRFYFQSPLPDAKEFASTHSAMKIWELQLLGRSWAAAALEKIAQNLRSYFTSGAIAEGEPVPSLRVSPEEFAANLHAFAAEARKLGSSLVYLTTPLNLPPPPAVPRELTVKELQAEADYRNGQWSHARAGFREVVTFAMPMAQEANRARYFLAALERREGHPLAARGELNHARSSEPGRVRASVTEYNELVKKVAREEHFPCVDVAALLKGNADYVDPVHTSAAGHARIAEELAKVIR